jgi:ABC-type phosphate transport system permease subunit
MEDQEKSFQETFHQPNDQSFWQQPLPNANTILALGIISILSCFWFCFIGLTLGIIALVMASKSNKLYLLNPNRYTASSYTNLKAGKICAIIGTCLSAIYLLIITIFLASIVAIFANMPWDMIK